MADKEETETGLNLEESTKPGDTPDLFAPEEGAPNLETVTSSDNNTIPGSEAASSSLSKDKTKSIRRYPLDILLKATANAPIMKKKKWAVSQDQHIGWISEFIKRYLKLDANERLFLYINQTFAPPPDQTVRNLYDCYGTDGKLIIHYCKSQAWG